MIDSTSSSGRSARAGLDPADIQKYTASPNTPLNDRLSTDKAQQLQQALANQPEIRPEVVARGMQLAADPSYPSAPVISNVAAQILNAPDLSEDES